MQKEARLFIAVTLLLVYLFLQFKNDEEYEIAIRIREQNELDRFNYLARQVANDDSETYKFRRTDSVIEIMKILLSYPIKIDPR